MISGITPRPRPVTIQFLAVTATPGRALARPRPAPQHIRFIVKPARDGQNKVYVEEYFLLTKKAGQFYQDVMISKHLGQ